MPSIPRPALLDGSFHHHLLRDRARLDAYARAIRMQVRPGDVVADVGSGSGILAWLAAQAGARRVHAVELNTNSYKALLRAVRRNDVLGRVVPTLADGTQWVPPEPVDVVVCELMETGLLHEPIAAIMRRVHAWDERPRAILPKVATLQVEGVEVRDEFLGYHATFPGFRATGGDAPLTDLVAYAEYDFERDAPPETLDAAFSLRVHRDGRLGGLQLRTTTEVAPGIHAAESPGYCTPVVLTLDEPLRVREGDVLAGRLRYDFSYTNEPIEFDVAHA